MDIKIKKIILWPKKAGESKKEIDFSTEKINVIVGDSQTGKSAIIPIIDYCLGSSKYTVPVGPIRKYTEWFGLLIEHKKTQILLARKEPALQQSTNQMFYDEGEEITIPDIITESNRTNGQVVDRLNQICHLPSLNFVTTEAKAKPYEERASFKDFLAFTFQPQHIIANPYTLFYKADTQEHRLKLGIVFPLALGLITIDTLEQERKLNILKEQLRVKQGILDDKKKIRNGWMAEIKSNYIQAIDLGLFTNEPFPEDDWTFPDYLLYLKEIPEKIKDFSFPKLEIGVTNRIATYIEKLQKSERLILDDLEDKKFKIAQFRLFNSGASEYRLALKKQQERLEAVENGWLADKISKAHSCPICGTENKSAEDNINNLVKSANDITQKTKKIVSSRDTLDKEIAELEKQIIELEGQLNSIREQLSNLGRQHQQLEQRRKDIENVYRFVGRIEQNLKNLKEVDIESNLFTDIIKLNDEIEKLTKKLLGVNNAQKRQDVLNRISQSTTVYKEILKVENPRNPTYLDLRQLTLSIHSDGSKNYLWEIGSGSNWMGYHVATILALQEYFLTLKQHNHIPTFMVYDQPSQAYFPAAIKNDIVAQKKSDDMVRVRAIFECFAKFLEISKNKSQVIVLEHADYEIWGDVENTFYVTGKRWVEADALIPNTWMDVTDTTTEINEEPK